MEKSSRITMTEDDWQSFKLGEVSNRLKTQYGIQTYDELDHIVSFLEYENVTE